MSSLEFQTTLKCPQELLGWVTWRQTLSSILILLMGVREQRAHSWMDGREQPTLALLKEVLGVEERLGVLYSHGRREEVPTLYSLTTLGKWKGTYTKRGDWGVSTYNDRIGLTGATEWSEQRKAMTQRFKLLKLVALKSGWQQITPSSAKEANLRSFENNLVCPISEQIMLS